MFGVIFRVDIVSPLSLYVILWFQHVHLLVFLSQFVVLHLGQLLFDRAFLVIGLLEHHGFLLELLLQLGRLWVKSVVVEPFLFEVCQFPKAK